MPYVQYLMLYVINSLGKKSNKNYAVSFLKTYLQDLLRRKDLLIYLVKSGLKAEHRNSYLGYFWWLLDPLLSAAVYYFLIVLVLGRGGPDYPVYLITGLILWRWMSSSINSSANSILRYSSIINQVYLPKSIFPLSFSITQFINFLFGLVVIFIFLIIFGVPPSWNMLYLSLILFVVFTFVLAIGLILGFFTIFIRDIENILTHIIRVFFYGSPIIWQDREIPEKYQFIVDFNPIAKIVTSFRNIMMYQKPPNLTDLAIIFVISVIVIVFMLFYYYKNEHKIIKARLVGFLRLRQPALRPLGRRGHRARWNGLGARLPAAAGPADDSRVPHRRAHRLLQSHPVPARRAVLPAAQAQSDPARAARSRCGRLPARERRPELRRRGAQALGLPRRRPDHLSAGPGLGAHAGGGGPHLPHLDRLRGRLGADRGSRRARTRPAAAPGPREPEADRAGGGPPRLHQGDPPSAQGLGRAAAR